MTPELRLLDSRQLYEVGRLYLMSKANDRIEWVQTMLMRKYRINVSRETIIQAVRLMIGNEGKELG